MKEADWLAANNPAPMIDFLEIHFEPVYRRAFELEEESPEYDPDEDPGVKAVARKMRLFAVGCCRHVAHLLTDARSREALDWTERFVDELAPASERRDIARAAGAALDAENDPPKHDAADAAYRATDDIMDEFTDAREAAEEAAAAVGWFADAVGAGEYEMDDRPRQAERAFQADLLREVIGNPFRRVRLDPAWQTPTVLRLARAAYDERRLPEGTLDPDRLAILADALEDAGCADADILSHCREPGRHVRGCWLLDLLTGRDWRGCHTVDALLGKG